MADGKFSIRETLDARETASNGAPAATCAAAHATSDAKKPGRVAPVLFVAARDAAYVLSCNVSGENAVERSWSQHWSDITPKQSSLHLPARK